MSGLVRTGGMTNIKRKVIEKDSLLVEVLKKKGAIIYLYSNVPQSYFSYESNNRLWGCTLNPWNKKKISGGSSGGESGLVSSLCSPLGIGSDIGGSIRVPSTFCGLYGFKPTSSRISREGELTFSGVEVDGIIQIQNSFGPICRSADDAIMITKELFGSFADDVYIDNSNFNQLKFDRVYNNFNIGEKIKIGWFTETNICTPAECISTIMDECVEKMSELGYEMVKFPIDDFVNLFAAGSKLYLNSDFLKYIKNNLEGEELADYYKDIEVVMNLPHFTLPIISKILSIMNKKRFSNIIGGIQILNKSEFFEESRKLINEKNDFIKFWKINNFTALICPVFPIPPVSIGVISRIYVSNQYTTLFNLVDMPSCSIPIKLNDSTTIHTVYNDSIDCIIKKELKESIGLPIGIQVGALPNEDEYVLGIMKQIGNIYQFEKKYPDEIEKILSTIILKNS